MKEITALEVKEWLDSGKEFQFVDVREEGEYAQELIDAEKELAAYQAANPNLVNIDNVTLLEDASDIEEGNSLFQTNCAVCHGANGEGGIGANLTDQYWIYDGGIAGTFNTIMEGGKNGMKSWKNDFTPIEIQKISSYILTLDFKEGKEAEGDKWEE